METPEKLVRTNVRELRRQRDHTVRSLSALLGQLGRPILPSGITKIEDGTRRVDVGDLVALAVALGVHPNRLLLPVDDTTDEVALTPAVRAATAPAWNWAAGRVPLLTVDEDWTDAERHWRLHDDFRRHALPAWQREMDDHTAVRAARDVFEGITEVIGRDGHARTAEAAVLRRDLARLVAEVEALIGDDDGQRQ